MIPERLVVVASLTSESMERITLLTAEDIMLLLSTLKRVRYCSEVHE